MLHAARVDDVGDTGGYLPGFLEQSDVGIHFHELLPRLAAFCHVPAHQLCCHFSP